MASGTPEELIDAAQRLMLRQGYAGTGINDICREVGVSKGAFYHSFASKEELTVAALTSFYRKGMDVFRSVDVSAAAPAEQLPLFVEGIAGRARFLWEHGCLIGGLSMEMALASDSLQKSVAQFFDQLAVHVTKLAKPFVESLPRGRPTAAALAEDFLATVEGAIVLSRAHRDPSRIRAALERYAWSLRRMQRS